ncbi:Copia protein, partial [Linum perenne]
GEVIWLLHLLTELGVISSELTRLFSDNQVSFHIASNLVLYKRTKHVDMDYHFVLEQVLSCEVLLLEGQLRGPTHQPLYKGIGTRPFAFFNIQVGHSRSSCTDLRWSVGVNGL